MFVAGVPTKRPDSVGTLAGRLAGPSPQTMQASEPANATTVGDLVQEAEAARLALEQEMATWRAKLTENEAALRSQMASGVTTIALEAEDTISGLQQRLHSQERDLADVELRHKLELAAAQKAAKALSSRIDELEKKEARAAKPVDRPAKIWEKGTASQKAAREPPQANLAAPGLGSAVPSVRAGTIRRKTTAG